MEGFVGERYEYGDESSEQPEAFRTLHSETFFHFTYVWISNKSCDENEQD
jgi:hypothetical protein